ncbi:MAG: twin-arginine translocation signal domain-containing protein [Smithellaceae bacterium]|nr:twin-arginine translocation signal domain-containing protein [Smithellaceae bacterium]
MKRRDFLKKAGVGTAAALAASAVNAPYVIAQKKTAIRLRGRDSICNSAFLTFNDVYYPRNYGQTDQ